MKWRTLIFSLVALSFLATLFADETPAKSTLGRNNFGAEVLESFTGGGLIKLHGTTVQNNLHIDGSLIAENATIHSLSVMGEANLTRSTIDEASVIGSLQAVHSTFTKNLTVQSQKMVFTACQLQGITVLKNAGFKGKQVIELRQGTLVHGPIRFESGKGEVILHPGSQALGPIDGGKTIKKH